MKIESLQAIFEKSQCFPLERLGRSATNVIFSGTIGEYTRSKIQKPILVYNSEGNQMSVQYHATGKDVHSVDHSCRSRHNNHARHWGDRLIYRQIARTS